MFPLGYCRRDQEKFLQRRISRYFNRDHHRNILVVLILLFKLLFYHHRMCDVILRRDNNFYLSPLTV
jgi:hypothetical protein